MDLIPILLLCFMLRLLQTLRRAGDNHVHLWKIRTIGRDLSRLCAVDDSLTPGYQGYPGLPHYLMGFLPERHRGVGAYLFNIITDLLIIVLTWAAATWLVNVDALPTAPESWPMSVPAAAALIYGTMPILMPQTGRMVAFGGRAFGALFLTGYFIVYGAAAYYGLPALYPLCIVLSIPILLGSQFGTQALVLLSLGASIIQLDYRPAALLVVVLTVAWFTPGLPIARILKHKINHFIWYSRNAGTFAAVDNRNRLADLLRLPRDLRRRPHRFWRQIFMDNTFIIAAYSVPTLLILLYWLARDPAATIAIRDEPVLGFLAALVLASCAAFLLVSLRPLAFLGQAERYFEYAAPALAMLFVEYLARHDRGFTAIWWIVVLHLTAVLAIFIYRNRHLLFHAAQEKQDGPFNELIGFLETCGSARVVTVPPLMSYRVRAGLDNPDMRFYYQFITGDRLDGFRYMEEAEAAYNRLGDDLHGLASRLGVDTLVLSDAARIVAERNGLDYRLAEHTLLFRNDAYAVYRLGSSSPDPAVDHDA